jgi:glycosyltransferase involved in cell wall biosynthesis
MKQETNFNFIQTCPFPRFIYSSSADRGLDTLLYLFPFIKKEFPGATLDIYYGFENWSKAIDQRNNEQEKRWKDQILTDMKQPGVNYHGRVSQDAVAKAFLEADIWFYPTRFTETYCITALEAQISKTAIVCTDLAALHTTVGDKGVLIQGDAYTKEYREQALKEVFAILKDEKRRNEMVERAFQWAKQQTWEARAKEMLQIFGIRS